LRGAGPCRAVRVRGIRWPPSCGTRGETHLLPGHSAFPTGCPALAPAYVGTSTGRFGEREGHFVLPEAFRSPNPAASGNDLARLAVQDRHRPAAIRIDAASCSTPCKHWAPALRARGREPPQISPPPCPPAKPSQPIAAASSGPAKRNEMRKRSLALAGSRGRPDP
jgi:hypothetical protein